MPANPRGFVLVDTLAQADRALAQGKVPKFRNQAAEDLAGVARDVNAGRLKLPPWMP